MFLHVALLKVVLDAMVFVVARLTCEGSVYISHIGSGVPLVMYRLCSKMAVLMCLTQCVSYSLLLKLHVAEYQLFMSECSLKM